MINKLRYTSFEILLLLVKWFAGDVDLVLMDNLEFSNEILESQEVVSVLSIIKLIVFLVQRLDLLFLYPTVIFLCPSPFQTATQIHANEYGYVPLMSNI